LDNKNKSPTKSGFCFYCNFFNGGGPSCLSFYIASNQYSQNTYLLVYWGQANITPGAGADSYRLSPVSSLLLIFGPKNHPK
jgi:hypothetical protein